MTVSLAAVFIPILFMGGVVGRLLHEFAVTIGVAILVSGFVSISLTPMLCSRFLKPPHEQRHGAMYQAIERMFDATRDLYDWTLRLSLRFHVFTMALSVALLIGTVWLFGMVPKGFLPSEDQGQFQCRTEAVQGIGFDEMVRHQKQIADIVARRPEHRELQQQRRRRSERRRAEHRTVAGRADPQDRANAVGRSGDCRAPAEARPGARHPRLHDQSAADQPGRTDGRPQPLSVHAAGHRYGGVVPVGAAARGEVEGVARHRRRQQRSSGAEPADSHRHGS